MAQTAAEGIRGLVLTTFIVGLLSRQRLRRLHSSRYSIPAAYGSRTMLDRR
jgi:hypothetical protein